MLEPIGNKVLIEVGKIEEKVGSIYLTTESTSKEQLAKQSGTVIAIGEFAYKSFGNGDPWVNVGDKVYFQKYGGIQHKSEQEDGSVIDYRIVNDEDIVAIIK